MQANTSIVNLFACKQAPTKTVIKDFQRKDSPASRLLQKTLISKVARELYLCASSIALVQPTAPSRLTSSRARASTANSIGSSLNTS